MLTLAMASIAAVAWGCADYIAGIAARRGKPLLMVAQASLVSLPMVALVAALIPAHISLLAILWGGVAGLCNNVGAFALYRGLAIGQMRVVAPISGLCAALLPALFGWAAGQHLTALKVMGGVLGLAAIGLVSGSSSSPGGQRNVGVRAAWRSPGVSEGIVAGIAFAVLFVALSRAGAGSGAWPLVAMQLSGLLFAVLALSVAPSERSGDWRRSLLPTAIVGLLSAGATAAYQVAVAHGLIAVASVTASLYPGVTVTLARLFLRERMSRWALAGVLLAGAAVTVLASG